MGRAALCFPLALLFLASVIPSKAQSEAGGAGGAVTEAAAGAGAGASADADADAVDVVYDVRLNITLTCTLPNDNSNFVWKINGTELKTSDRVRTEKGGAVLAVSKSVEDDWGNYSCGVQGGERELRWRLRARPHLKLPANTNVVEGQTLKLTCKVTGKPYPRVQWSYSNSSADDANFTGVRDLLGDRLQLNVSEQGVQDGLLTIEAAARGDAGRYRCGAEGAAATAETTLRVKDMYAALWPFLGICAEVFVLCAIILVYEKRRTKPDLDDSDTDNHDQKKS